MYMYMISKLYNRLILLLSIYTLLSLSLNCSIEEHSTISQGRLFHDLIDEG